MRRASRGERVIVVIGAMISAALLIVAALLSPDARGLGTHEQLGLPPCSFLRWSGLPCPTCGMTTAFAHAVRGDVGAALRAQVLGTMMALACALMALLGPASAVAGRVPERAPLSMSASLRVLAILTIAAWGTKILMFRGFPST